MSTRKKIMGVTAALLLAGTTLAAPAASAATAPVAPTGLHQIGTAHGQAVYGWNAAPGAVSWYSIRLDGHQVRRDIQRTRQVQVYDLYLYGHAQRGHSYTLSIVAVDASGNHSAPGAGVVMTVA